MVYYSGDGEINPYTTDRRIRVTANGGGGGSTGATAGGSGDDDGGVMSEDAYLGSGQAVFIAWDVVRLDTPMSDRQTALQNALASTAGDVAGLRFNAATNTAGDNVVAHYTVTSAMSKAELREALPQNVQNVGETEAGEFAYGVELNRPHDLQKTPLSAADLSGENVGDPAAPSDPSTTGAETGGGDGTTVDGSDAGGTASTSTSSAADGGGLVDELGADFSRMAGALQTAGSRLLEGNFSGAWSALSSDLMENARPWLIAGAAVVALWWWRSG